MTQKNLSFSGGMCKDFFVKSSYERLYYLSDSALHVDELILGVLKRLWKTNALSKVILFGWKLLLIWLPNKDGLDRRGILSGRHNLVCPMCFDEDELVPHLFLQCNVIVHVWIKIFGWLGIIMHDDLVSLVAH